MKDDIEPKIQLVGEICVDVFVGTSLEKPRVMLGGVMHAARALGALEIPYNLYYTAPSYIHKQVQDSSTIFGAQSAEVLGSISGSPNVLLVADQRETSSQGYELLLRDDYICEYDPIVLSKLEGHGDTSEVLLICYGSEISEVFSSLAKSNAKVHIDLGQSFRQNDLLSLLKGQISTIILSTSSEDFLDDFQGSVTNLCEHMLGYSESLLFKENRGGVRLFNSSQEISSIQVGAQTRPIIHSVGVGDCFDAAFVSLLSRFEPIEAMSYTTWISAEYACYRDWDSFKRKVNRIMNLSPREIVELEGTKLAWEDREDFNIYIAAPDFDYIDRSHIDHVQCCLEYHNFKPRLPIRESGQAAISDTPSEKARLFQADMTLLDECSMLLAILVEQDDGTMIEIGLASGRRMPVVVYDPNRIAHNLVLQNLPDFYSSDIDEILTRVFEIAARAVNE